MFSQGPLGVGPTNQYAESDHNSGPANALQVCLFALRVAAALSKEPPTIGLERSILPKKEPSAMSPEEIGHFFRQLL
jgi:hypothetical protein